ncbi:hypothetical protein ACFYYN_28570 [Streptomyces sp. NPDC001902]|nr:hypothetical protein [Streptomyces sp. PA03-1a]MDX2707847.1 hypothetical protein [Streptomyces sp. PA03-6a]MDX2816311.1 hypothetical protein [Streptomyces sp. PA03-5A]
MAGFRSLARQVRDPRRSPTQRRTYLRRCLERFAPYGHRATWDHLCAGAGIAPDDREPDPVRLVTALAELEEARAVWLTYEGEFAARRKEEKFYGIRQPGALDDWHRRTWGGNGVAWCEDPRVHPDDRLADVLRRIIAAIDAGPGTGCPVCGESHLRWRNGLNHYPGAGPVCGRCGIVVPLPVLCEAALAEARGALAPTG